MNIAIYTLGCKVNQYETQAMESELINRGHEMVSFDAPADIYIINTCTVTAVSDRKSRNAIHRARKLSPNAIVAVCGCYSQTEPKAVAELGVDLITGTGDRISFIHTLEEMAGKKTTNPIIHVDEALKRREFETLSAGGMEGRTRASLKIEDGCVNFCSYCIIPYARGPVRSLALEDAVAEAKKLAESGYREIVLTGIEISSYGSDFGSGTTLIDLMEALCEAVPELRIRLGSLEPRTITREFCERTANLQNLCPHFHLSLQSGCDETLKRMNRKYDTPRYEESVRLLREYFDDPGITTDLIVGFPGETEVEFAHTLEFIKKCGFSAMHIFPYSKRSGTPAAAVKEQSTNKVKTERAHRAGELSALMEQQYRERQLGKVLPVLFERDENGMCRGHAPNYTEVIVCGSGLHNVLASVLITGQKDGCLMGELQN
jgi:threonylcarbamoyladenosine tRNA methylthiotransferase MtaB